MQSELLDGMLAHLRRRGPDGIGRWCGPESFLATTRLGIVAPDSASGPYEAAGGRVRVVANGEIYNEPELREALKSAGYVFRTEVDTEVLAHAYDFWGTSFVERLDGIFAFVLLDLGRRQLMAARDPLGVKPLYLRRIGPGVVYASTCAVLNAIGGDGGELCHRALVEFLYRQSIAAPRTIFRHIESVEPGTSQLVAFGSGSVSVSRYWSPAPAYSPQATPVDERVEARLDGVLHATCVAQSRTDRHTRLALSGGIDSALLASECVSSGLGDAAVFLRLPGNRDESRCAQMTATWCGLEFRRLSPLKNLDAAIEDWLAVSDGPPSDGFNTYLLCGALPSQVAVLYSGLGADELFFGYPELNSLTADGSHIIDRFLRATALIPPDTLGVIAEWLEVDLRDVVLEIRGEIEEIVNGVRDYGPAEALRHLLIRRYLSSRLLADADTYSMCHGVEMRVPYLSRDIVSLALSVPPPTPQQRSKPILRALANRRGLPTGVVDAPKRGFTLPYNSLLHSTIGSAGRLGLAPDHPATPFRTWVLWSVARWAARRGRDLPSLLTSLSGGGAG